MRTKSTWPLDNYSRINTVKGRALFQEKGKKFETEITTIHVDINTMVLIFRHIARVWALLYVREHKGDPSGQFL